MLCSIFSTQVGSRLWSIWTFFVLWQKKIIVNRDCANLEIMTFNNYHIQTVRLKWVLLLTSKYFLYKIGIKDGSENGKAIVRNISYSCLPGFGLQSMYHPGWSFAIIEERVSDYVPMAGLRTRGTVLGKVQYQDWGVWVELKFCVQEGPQ